jgi:hypothetical protein
MVHVTGSVVSDVAKDFQIIVVMTLAVFIATATVIRMEIVLLVNTACGVLFGIKCARHTVLIVAEIVDSTVVVKPGYG